MNMFDEARSIAGMMSLCKISQSETARRMGVSQSYVANKLRLLHFDEGMQRRIIDSGISERHARALLALSGEELEAAFNKVTAEGLTVAETEAIADLYRVGRAAKIAKNATRVAGIESFLVGIRKSVDLLAGLGVTVNERVGRHGERTYVTICIEE